MNRSTLVLVFLVSALSACAAPAPARRDVVIGLIGEPASVFADDPGARVIAAAVTEPLVALDAHGEFVARLAAEVPTLENGDLAIVNDDPSAPGGRLVATFRLRDGLVWQDGTPITAQDVRFAHDVDVAAAPGSEVQWTADRIESIEVVDEHVVRVAYRAGERWTNYPLAPRVLPRHILATADAARRIAYAREPVHAGAFSVAAWVPGYGVTLSAFKDHVGGAPALGRLEVRFFPDRTAILDALRRGLIDVAPSPTVEADLARTLDKFADANRVVVYKTPAEALEILRFSSRGPFAERAVRKAVELAVDRQGIVDDVFAGLARVPRSYLVPPLWAAAESGPTVRPDRDAARALLAEAGYRHGSFGILERDIDRLSVTLLVVAGSQGRIDAARRVAGDLAPLGIAVDVRASPAADVKPPSRPVRSTSLSCPSSLTTQPARASGGSVRSMHGSTSWSTPPTGLRASTTSGRCMRSCSGSGATSSLVCPCTSACGSISRPVPSAGSSRRPRMRPSPGMSRSGGSKPAEPGCPACGSGSKGVHASCPASSVGAARGLPPRITRLPTRPSSGRAESGGGRRDRSERRLLFHRRVIHALTSCQRSYQARE